mmetsp:Transcript_20322/g.58745  ORF Transcript_20322/g.58745 Transcript_20322/m.58745 type:complete len:231 (-) Transcript_20322:561-1253(-)
MAAGAEEALTLKRADPRASCSNANIFLARAVEGAAAEATSSPAFAADASAGASSTAPLRAIARRALSLSLSSSEALPPPPPPPPSTSSGDDDAARTKTASASIPRASGEYSARDDRTRSRTRSAVDGEKAAPSPPTASAGDDPIATSDRTAARTWAEIPTFSSPLSSLSLSSSSSLLPTPHSPSPNTVARPSKTSPSSFIKPSTSSTLQGILRLSARTEASNSISPFRMR